MAIVTTCILIPTASKLGAPGQSAATVRKESNSSVWMLEMHRYLKMQDRKGCNDQGQCFIFASQATSVAVQWEFQKNKKRPSGCYLI